MKHTLYTKTLGWLALSALMLGSAQVAANDKADAEKTVNGAVSVLKNFSADPNLIWYRENIPKAKAVMTDSGGIQEETTVLGIPCLTLRDTTDGRPITLTQGTNILVHNDKKQIIDAMRKLLKEQKQKANCPKLWDGRTAERIIDILYENLS